MRYRYFMICLLACLATLQLQANTNTTIGHRASYRIDGTDNTAVGDSAMAGSSFPNSNTYPIRNSSSNTALGAKALPLASSTNKTIDQNVAVGFNASAGATTYSFSVFINTAFGYKAVSNAPYTHNTGFGYLAVEGNGVALIKGINNSGFGNEALRDFLGPNNSAFGYHALRNNKLGSRNSAFGTNSLTENSNSPSEPSSSNSAFGFSALTSNKTGNNNCAFGDSSLATNTKGTANSAFGLNSLFANESGNNNCAFGGATLLLNTSGSANCAFGDSSLFFNTSGGSNVALGNEALSKNQIGSGNTALGANADVSTFNLEGSTAIGFGAIVDASNKIRLGNLDVTVVEGAMYTVASDARFKTDVKENVPGLSFINQLRPVTYNFDVNAMAERLKIPSENRSLEDELLHSQISKTGFIAQEVEIAAQNIGYDFEGVQQPQNAEEYYGLAYSSFIPSIVKSIQEQQETIQSQQLAIDKLRDTLQQKNHLINQLGKEIKALKS